MGLGTTIEGAKRLWATFGRDGGALLSAALAYSALFAMAPALMLVVVVGRLLLDEAAVTERLFTVASSALGPGVGSQIEVAVNAYLQSRSDRIGVGVVGVALLVWAVGILFGRITQAFNMMWHVRLRRDLTLGRQFRLQAQRLVFALLPAALAVTAGATAALAGWLARLLGVGADVTVGILESPLTIALIAWLALVILYRMLPYADVRTADVAIPALVVAVAWTGGTWLFGVFLGRGAWSPAAAAGSIFVLLLWLNYSAQALLLGCASCRLIAEKRGRGGPSEDAERAVPRVDKD